MTSPDITLQKVEDVLSSKDKSLPFGIYAITFDNKLVFVRRVAGRFMPVSAQEQEKLCQQFLP